MNSPLKFCTPLIALLVLSACGDAQRDTTPEGGATPTEGAMASMAGAEGEGAATNAKSTGTITALDKEGGKVTLDHEAIPEVEWPAMTMGFDADPALLSDLQVGDRVAFDVEIVGSGGKVTALTKQ